ncbi:MAG: hypothetical protein HFJ59_03080 [Clostridia bacterium]|nr:hypothetical protein [Clostridia bacterium]
MSEQNLSKQMESLLKEMKEIKENQKIMNDKMEKMQQIINHIENDIYAEEGFDFEIVCPYCEYEFVIDADESKKEIECPECKNIIELDWSGNFDEGDGNSCLGHCHGCAGCEEDNEEDDDM